MEKNTPTQKPNLEQPMYTDSQEILSKFDINLKNIQEVLHGIEDKINRLKPNDYFNPQFIYNIPDTLPSGNGFIGTLEEITKDLSTLYSWIQHMYNNLSEII